MSLSKSGFTCSASCSGKGSSLEKDRVAGAGSGCGRIGVKSTVAPACTSADRESQTCREISCLNLICFPFRSFWWDYLDILHVVESLLFIASCFGCKCQALRIGVEHVV